ncbi:MAG: EAL domain-containing protein [Rhodoferax sp.]|nr:EAL domain-containing protein [Rhodoferax sp.]
MKAATRSIKITIGALVALFLGALVAAASFLEWNARQNALSDSAAQVTRFVSGAEAAVNRSLLGIDVLLAGTDDLLGLSGSMVEWIDVKTASQLLRSAARQNLMVRFVALVDAQGRVVASSDAAGANMALELPVGFLDQAMSQPVSTLTVSAPAVSFASSERVLYMGRYVRLADGTKLLAVVEVPTAMLTSVLMQGVDITGLEVTLERSSGHMLLGVPHDITRASGLLSPPLGTLAREEGPLRMAARLSTVPALVEFRPTLYLDLWICASIPLDAALSEWRSERNAVIAVTLVFGLMVLAAAGFAMVYVNRITAARLAIAQSKVVLDQALESMESGFALLDAQHRVVQWNRRFLETFPWLVPLMVPLVPFRNLIEANARHHLPDAGELEHKRWVEDRLRLQSGDAESHELELLDGRIIQITERDTPEGGLVITYHDVTDIRRASAEIETLAFFDPLTALPNRRLLLDRLTQAIAASTRSGQMGALLFLDLDHFKTINDTLGHEVGDQLLQHVAQRLSACVRDADTVARLGGDEFVVMLKDLSDTSHQAAAQVQQIGDKILNSLNQPYTLGAQPYRSTCSLGATLFGPSAHGAADLLKQADIAMYQVKAQRGNAMCFFDPQMQADINQRARLETDLQQALAQGQFELYYQPQFTLDTRMVGAEVLLRWHHPQRGMVSPTEFIAVAEERELIVPIGLWVLRTACAQLAVWQKDARYANLQLSVNVSARQFHQPDFVEQVCAAITATGIPPHLLKLELTESSVLDNVDESVHKMGLLKAEGVQFSVDDFGTGYSSLAYLTRLPLNQLKIDQSFVRNLGVRSTDGVIVQTIIGMARNLGLEVIAEGVETVAQKDFLAAHGCTMYQGYLLARPGPVAALEGFLPEV